MGQWMRSGLRLRLGVELTTAGSFAVLLLLAACVSDVDTPTPDGMQPGAGAGGSSGGNSTGSAGSGGSTGTNTAGAGGGSNDYTSDPTFAMGVNCPMVMQALLTDFTPPAAAAVADAGADAGDAGAAPAAPPTNITFGDFTNTLSGSSFTYPGDGQYAVRSDVSAGNWHMTGTLGNYSGFGIVFVGCYAVDASAYQGISFTVRGSVPMGSTITLGVGTAADEISHVWLNRNAMPLPNPPAPTNRGRCIPAATQYDGTCAQPTFAVPVTAETTTINVTWAQLTAGRPAATVDPSEITNISWTFPPPVGAGTANPTTYDVDITIDDLRFIAP
jgi:hypothetical protein